MIAPLELGDLAVTATAMEGQESNGGRTSRGGGGCHGVRRAVT